MPACRDRAAKRRGGEFDFERTALRSSTLHVTITHSSSFTTDRQSEPDHQFRPFYCHLHLLHIINNLSPSSPPP